MFITDGECRYLKEEATDILLMDQTDKDAVALEGYALATLIDFIVSREEKENNEWFFERK